MAVALGSTLALLYVRDAGRRIPFLGVIHGIAGAVGFCLLVIALQGPRRGEAMGVGSFGAIAAVLFAAALLFGPLIAVSSKRAQQLTGLVIATHASVAIIGFVLLLAWVSLG